MVQTARFVRLTRPLFQYSLCRVVLMVGDVRITPYPPGLLSVLALSSRFDGLDTLPSESPTRCSFSTRSVESF